MDAAYYLQFLSGDERRVLRWIKTQDPKDRLESVWAHGLAVGDLRGRGLAKYARRPGWTTTVLTKQGEAVLALLNGQASPEK